MVGLPAGPSGAFPVVRLEGGAAVVRMGPVEAALPGTLAVFSTRRGGVSRPPWDEMNVGQSVGDDPEAVAENRRRLFGGLGVDPERLASCGQVHGRGIALVAGPGRVEATDALVTATPGLTLAVSCADCVPVFLLDPVTPAAGIVHAGWKGTLARLAALTVRFMARRLGSRPSDIVAAVGPSIGACCYEVGPDVAAEAEDRLGRGVLLPAGAGRLHLDLWEANRLALVSAGLEASRVHLAGLCTCCREDLFHSHRRASRAGGGGRAGRMVGLVRLPVGRRRSRADCGRSLGGGNLFGGKEVRHT